MTHHACGDAYIMESSFPIMAYAAMGVILEYVSYLPKASKYGGSGYAQMTCDGGCRCCVNPTGHAEHGKTTLSESRYVLKNGIPIGDMADM